MTRAVSVERRVAITLWHLATNTDYHSIEHMFGVGKGTVCIIVNEVCRAIVTVLMKQYINCYIVTVLMKHSHAMATCMTKNVVYLIWCRKCQKHYV